MNDLGDAHAVIIDPRDGKDAQIPSVQFQRKPCFLIAPSSFIQSISPLISQPITLIPHENFDPEQLGEPLKKGAHLIWIGPPSNLHPTWWIDTYQPLEQTGIICEHPFAPIPFHTNLPRPAKAYCAFLKPPQKYVYHNIDEIPRAEFLPLWELQDSIGKTVGYPAILLKHAKPALTSGNYTGGHWFFFFIENPSEFLTINEWLSLLNSIFSAISQGLYITFAKTTFTSYYPSEKPHLDFGLKNCQNFAQAVKFSISITQAQNTFKHVTTLWRVIEPNDESIISHDLPSKIEPGLHHVRIDVSSVPGKSHLLTERENPKLLFSQFLSFVMLPDKTLVTPKIVNITDSAILINKEKRFWIGTHYYPSTSWWEWLWRDFRPALVDQDFATMRAQGYRLVRIWVDPDLDEVTLRAQDTAIYLAAKHGLVLDITLFNQWLRQLSFPDSDGTQVSFEFRNPEDFNIYGFSLRNLSLQRKWVETLARRWANVGNIIYNLSNEVYINSPNANQMDQEVSAWQVEQHTNQKPIRDALLFANWTHEIKKIIHAISPKTPIICGYTFFTLDGGDTWLCNQHSDIIPWHNYAAPKFAAHGLKYFDSTSKPRPILLEEFGCAEWNNPDYYLATLHYAIGANAAGALSYEWGVRWMSTEQSFWPLPMRDILTTEVDPRAFPPARELANTMPPNGAGAAGYVPGFVFGSIYHGTPFLADAALIAAKFATFGEYLAPTTSTESVCVIAPDDAQNHLETYAAVFELLWKKHIPFTVWRTEMLDSLPKTTQFLICPVPLSLRNQQKLQKLVTNNLKILTQKEEIEQLYDQLPHFELYSSIEIHLITRTTPMGRLFVLCPANSSDYNTKHPITLNTTRSKVTLTMEPFAMVLEKDSEPVLFESSGEVTWNKTKLLESDAPVFFAAPHNTTLLKSNYWFLLPLKPCKIELTRPIQSVKILQAQNGQNVHDVTLLCVKNSSLRIPKELVHYLWQIQFK